MNVPPKTLKRQVTSLDRRPSGAKSGLSQATPESMPALKVLQDFLNVERRRIRTRMVTLAGFFLLIFFGLAASGLFVGRIFLNQLHQDIRAIQKDVETSRQTAVNAKSNAKALLDKYRKESTAFRKEMEARQQASADVESIVGTQIDDYNKKFENMTETVETLEQENTDLKNDLNRITMNWLALTNRIELALLEMANSQFEPSPPREILVVNTQPSLRPISETETVVVSIPLPDSDDTVLWRVPIPE